MNLSIWQVLFYFFLTWFLFIITFNTVRTFNFFYVARRIVARMNLVAHSKACNADDFLTYAALVKEVLEKGPKYYRTKVWIWTQNQYLGEK
jgi:hypothetical protein